MQTGFFARDASFFLSCFSYCWDGGRGGALQFFQPTRVSRRNTFRWTFFKGGETVGEQTPFFREEEERTRLANSKMPQLLAA